MSDSPSRLLRRRAVVTSLVLAAIAVAALIGLFAEDRRVATVRAWLDAAAAQQLAVEHAIGLAFELHLEGATARAPELRSALLAALDGVTVAHRELVAAGGLDREAQAVLAEPPFSLVATLPRWVASARAWAAAPPAAAPDDAARRVADGCGVLVAAIGAQLAETRARAGLLRRSACVGVAVALLLQCAVTVATSIERAEAKDRALEATRDALDDETSMLRQDRDRFEKRRRESEADSHRMLSLLEDLAAQKEQLTRAESQFRIAVEAAPNAMVMVDHRGTIALVNDQAERVFGFSRGELLGSSIEMLVPADARARHPEHRDAFFFKPEVRPMGASRELFGLRKDGTLVPVEIGLNPIQTAQGLYVLSSIIDITERVRARREIEAYARDLERSNGELAQFAYVASHDLREPIRMVQSFGELLREHAGASLDDPGLRYLEFILDGARRMGDLVEGLLAYSRAGRGLRSERLDLRAVLDDVLADLRVSIAEANACVDVVGEPPTLEFDGVALRQVLQNLIGNAIKFRGDRTPQVEIACERGDGAWIVRVSDNGIGIDPRFHERIFGVFQRLHTRAEYAGTGIGLSVVKRVIERRGGRIWIEPRGTGSTFAFSVPDDVPASVEAA